MKQGKGKEFCQENKLFIANTLFQHHKRRLYTWKSPDGQHQNQIDYILGSQNWRSSIQSAKTRLGADCGSTMNSLLPNSDINWRKWGKPLDLLLHGWGSHESLPTRETPWGRVLGWATHQRTACIILWRRTNHSPPKGLLLKKKTSPALPGSPRAMLLKLYYA